MGGIYVDRDAEGMYSPVGGHFEQRTVSFNGYGP
jgi:hypothetical protein